MGYSLMDRYLKGVAVLVIGFVSSVVSAGDWVSLFDGKTLDGWEIHGGKATYKVEDGAIVGTSAPNTPNTFLCTKKRYGNFVLEYEYFPHPKLNCGVQFRSQIREKDDRVWGYQCEIDPSSRRWSAGIFAEASRGWLYPVETDKAKGAYKAGEWNTIRIVCFGPVSRTYLNGIPVAEIVDDAETDGIIGLQIHGVGGNKTPMSLKWRNLRIKELAAGDEAELLEADTDTMGMLPPRGADVLLGSGLGLEKWQLRPKKVPWMKKYEPGNLQWTVDQETGVATPKPLAGSMDTKKHYGTQRIHVEFKTPPYKEGDRPEVSGNSGIYIQGSYELQICNSFGLEPADNRTGGLYKQRVPDVNAGLAPESWQTYDIYFVPAQFDDNKKKIGNARISAKLNGKWIHRNVEVKGPTGGGDKEVSEPRTLRLQEHQHEVQFRNVWVSDIDNPTTLKKYDPRKKNQVR